MRKQLYLCFFIVLTFFKVQSQCGCEQFNCGTTVLNVSLYQIYYGDIITLTAPALPPNWWGGSGYAWFTLTTKTSDDPNQASQYHTPFINGQITNNYTIDPLDYSANYNPSVGLYPTVDYFMCRTNSKASSGSSTTCFYGRSIKVQYSNVPAPIANVGTNISICQGDSIKLKATKTVGTLEWHTTSSTGALVGYGDSIWVKPASTISYFVKAKNGTSGYSISYSVCDTINITVNALPIVTANSNATNNMVCVGQSVTLNGGGATTYTWSNGINNNVSFVPASTKTYTVTGQTNGCVAASAITVTVATPVAPTVTSSNSLTTLCSGSDYLHSNSSSNYVWFYNGSVITSASSANYFPTQSGFYEASGADANGCVDTSSLYSFNVNQTPTASISVSPSVTVCQNDTVTLTSNYASGNVWSNSLTTQSIKVTTSGNYFVTVTSNSCSNTSSSYSITVKSLPTTPTINQNGNVLASSSASNNQWYLNGQLITGATSQFYTAAQSGIYSVAVTVNGCSAFSNTVTAGVTTDINKVSNSVEFEIYPNPTKERITIALNNNALEYTFKITNTLGQIVLSNSITQQVSDIEVGNLASGIYFVYITNSATNTVGIKKIVIQ